MRNGKEIDIHGNVCYYKDGKYHREDGPAIEFRFGTKFWYLNNVKYTKEEHKVELRKLKLQRIRELLK